MERHVKDMERHSINHGKIWKDMRSTKGAKKELENPVNRNEAGKVVRRRNRGTWVTQSV